VGFDVTDDGFTVLLYQAPSTVDGYDKQVLSVNTQSNQGRLTTYVSWRTPATNTLDLIVQISEMTSNQAAFYCEGTWQDNVGFTNRVDIYGVVPLPFHRTPEWLRSLHSHFHDVYK
jgi:hypothetical protein